MEAPSCLGPFPPPPIYLATKTKSRATKLSHYSYEKSLALVIFPICTTFFLQKMRKVKFFRFYAYHLFFLVLVETKSENGFFFNLKYFVELANILIDCICLVPNGLMLPYDQRSPALADVQVH